MKKTKIVRLKPGEKYKPICIVPTVKHPLSIMVWSVILGKGTDHLYIVDNTMRQDQYYNILETRLIPQLRDWFSNKDNPIFMHDGEPCQKTKSIKSFKKKVLK